MRISDLSSDVCSSDLVDAAAVEAWRQPLLPRHRGRVSVLDGMAGDFREIGGVPAHDILEIGRRLALHADDERPRPFADEAVGFGGVFAAEGDGVQMTEDRKGVVEGKGWYVAVDPGGCRTSKKKKSK